MGPTVSKIDSPDSTPNKSGRVFETLDIRPEEARRTSLLFSYLFLVGVIFTMGRTARDALFLTEYPTKWLPWMSVAYGLVSAAIIPFYATMSDRFRRDRFNGAYAVGVATAYCAAWGLIRAGWTPVLPVLYVFVEITSNLLVVQFWTMAGDLHDAREAKRLFGIIGSSRMVGIVVCGLSVGAIVGLIGTASLLLVNAFLLLLTAFNISRIGRDFIKDVPVRKTTAFQTAPAQASGKLWKSGYVILIVALFLLAFTEATIADYQFKVIARQNYQAEKLAAFFALFYGLTGAIAFFFHFFISSRLLAFFGMAVGLLVMPLLMGTSSLWLWLSAGSLMSAAALKFSDNAFQFTINDSALQLLYYPFAPEVKAKIKSMIEGAIKPVGYAMGGLVVVWLGARLGPVGLVSLAIPIVIGWIVVILFLRRHYLKALVSSLAQRRLDTGTLEVPPSPEVIELLSHNVETGSGFQAEFALKNLSEISPADATRTVEGLLKLPARQRFALDNLRDLPVNREVIEGLLSSSDPDVRIGAIRALGSVAEEEALDRLTPFLSSPNSIEADTACVTLIRTGGLEGVLATADHLRDLLKGDEYKRLRAARILGNTEVSAFGRSLLPLVNDLSSAVRIEALKAAGRVKHPSLLQSLIQALGDWHTRSVAILSIQQYREQALHALISTLKNNETPIDIRYRVPKLLRAVDAPEAVDQLWAFANHPDDSLRYQVLRNLTRCRPEWTSRIGGEKLPDLLKLEARSAATWFARRRNLSGRTRDQLLTEALDRRIILCGRRVMDLLKLQINHETISRIQMGLESGDRGRVGTALETIDNLLGREERQWVVPLLDPHGWNEADHRLAALFPDRNETETETTKYLRDCSDPYFTAAWLKSMPVEVRNEEIDRISFSASAMSHLAIEEIYLSVMNDPDKRQAMLRVAERFHVRRVIEHAHSYQSPGGPYRMLSTLERVLFLKSVSLFQQVPGDELAGLAQEAHAVTFDRGDVIFERGDVGDSLYLIVNGKVKIFVGDNELAQLGPGECFGEMAILDNAPRSASVSAVEPVLALQITQEDFIDILGDHPEISRGIFAVLVSRLRKSDERVRELMSNNLPAGASGSK